MEYLVNSREMKNCDRNTIEEFGVPSEVLMERAALSVVSCIKEGRYPMDRILVVCGNGNNGGDGVAVARLLALEGYDVTILLADSAKKFSDGMKRQTDIAKKYGLNIIEEWQDKDYTLIVDAIFGIGLSRAIEGKLAILMEHINASKSNVVSIDIASGISTDSGQVMGIAVKADMTVTFAYKKLGQILYPGADYTGILKVCDIGIEAHSWLGKKPSYYAVQKKDLAFLPKRENRSHKGSYGKVLLIAGSSNMAGAAILAAKAAYASGAGLVRVFTAEENRTAILSNVPEAILIAYGAKKTEKAELTAAIQWADVVAIGPGIGTDAWAGEMVKTVLNVSSVPVIMDADALNILAMDSNQLLRPHTELIVTPHLGEMASLREVPVSYIKDNLISEAEEFARTYNVICVLKDARTICSIPYGKTYVNLSGNHGMATAGSGDVLCGLLAGLVAQGTSPELAAPLGVYIHGRSGDMMAEEVGYHGLMASDIAAGIKKVMKIEGEESENL